MDQLFQAIRDLQPHIKAYLEGSVSVVSGRIACLVDNVSSTGFSVSALKAYELNSKLLGELEKHASTVASDHHHTLEVNLTVKCELSRLS